MLFFKTLLYLNGLAAALAPGADLLVQVAQILAHFQSKYAEAMTALEGPRTA